MQTLGEMIQVWNFGRLNFGHLFDVQPVWLLRISFDAETIFSQSSPVYHWTTSLRAAPWFPVLTARQRAGARSLDKKPKAEHTDTPPPHTHTSRLSTRKVNDGTEDGCPEYLQWSWEREKRMRMMIDCARSGLSRQTEPPPPKEHHLLSAQVTYSAALTCVWRRAC